MFISCRLKEEQTTRTINKLWRIVLLYRQFRKLYLTLAPNEEIRPRGKHVILITLLHSYRSLNMQKDTRLYVIYAKNVTIEIEIKLVMFMR